MDWNDGEAVENEIQGEIKRAALSGLGRLIWGILFEGWGWARWRRRAGTRFPPAESPARIIWMGSDGQVGLFRWFSWACILKKAFCFVHREDIEVLMQLAQVEQDTSRTEQGCTQERKPQRNDPVSGASFQDRIGI